MEGNEGTMMGDGIQVNRVAERFCSHTQMPVRPRQHRTSRETQALRKQLVAALVDVVAEGGDPRLR